MTRAPENVAAERCRIALAAVAAITHEKHAAVQPRLFDLAEGGERRGS